MSPAMGYRCLRSIVFLAATLLLGAIGSASSQEAPLWKFRIGGGVLISSGRDARVDALHRLTLDHASPVVTIDAVRSLNCCLETFISAVVPSIPTTILANGRTIPASRVSPVGVHFGLNYLWRRDANLQFFAGPLLGIFTKERAVGRPPDDDVAVSIQHTVAAGINAGVSRVIKRRALPDDDTQRRKKRLITRDEWVLLSFSARWQAANLRAGDVGRIGWNPLMLTGGITIHLW